MSVALSRVVLRLGDPTRPADELKRLQAFRTANPSDFLADRPEEQIKHTIESGLSFTAELEAEEEGGADVARIVAFTGVFEHGCSGFVHEVGAIRVNEEVQGYGLQRLLMQVAVLHIAEQGVNLVQNSDWTVVAVVADANQASIKSIERAGFVNAAPSESIPRALGRQQADFIASKKRLYLCKKTQYDRIRSDMKIFVQSGAILNHRSNASKVIVFGPRLERYGKIQYYV